LDFHDRHGLRFRDRLLMDFWDGCRLDFPDGCWFGFGGIGSLRNFPDREQVVIRIRRCGLLECLHANPNACRREVLTLSPVPPLSLVPPITPLPPVPLAGAAITIRGG
jgi:hypothetical protein